MPRPNDATLRNFKLGLLPPDEMAAVGQWIDETPGAADELSRVAARDRVTDALADTNSGNTSVVPVACAAPLAADVPAELDWFRTVCELGRGGMGIVLKAHDTKLGRGVAVKIIAPQFAADAAIRERFMREARAVATIDHPNVVPVYQVGESAGVPYLVMPLLEGEPLDARLRRVGRLPVAEVKRIGREVAAGLAAAHAAGLVHRDIKPGNIWLDRGTDRARVLDFGLAKPLDRAETDPPLTRAGAIVGTPHYMAPEQAAGRDTDARTDLFSLGVVLYQMATGERPFTGETVFAVIAAVAAHEPPEPQTLNPELPPGLSKLIGRLLEKAAEARPQSAEAVEAELSQPDLPVPVGPVDPWSGIDGPDDEFDETEVDGYADDRPRAAPARPRRGVWAAVAFGLLAVVAFGVYQLVFTTKEGTLVVEVSDEADVRFKSGALQVYDAAGKLKYTLKPGERNAKMPAGRYTVRVIGADGVELNTDVFTMTKDGKVALRVMAKAATPVAAKDDPDRKAAEAVIEGGGRVALKGQTAYHEGPLPKEPFHITRVVWRKTATDAGMALLKDCKHLTELDVLESQVTNAGAAHFKGRTNLTHLNLQGTRVTGAGYENFKNCTKLRNLGLRTLFGLQRGTDVDVANFKDCKKLTSLDLTYNAVTDVGVGYFKDCVGLEHLFLTGCDRISDASLAQVKDYPLLYQLDLQSTPITDAGAEHLRGCKNLTELDLIGTRVTEGKAAELAKALPWCRIAWADRVFEPTAPDRGAAHHVFVCGGSVRINGGNRDVTATADLPRDDFRLTRIDLKGVTDVGDGAMERFKTCKHVTHLDLTGAGVSEVGLNYFAGNGGLTVLVLDGCKRVTDAAMASMKNHPQLAVLVLRETAITDAGVEHLKACQSLKELWVNAPKVTAGKVVQLQKSLPNCKIVWSGGIIDPSSK